MALDARNGLEEFRYYAWHDLRGGEEEDKEDSSHRNCGGGGGRH